MGKRSYDERCLTLAQFFLKDEGGPAYSEADEEELAQAIQDTIEDWLAAR